MICLDTNIAIYVINRRVPAIRHRLAEQLRLGAEIGLPAIALFELRYGHAHKFDRDEANERRRL
jgi:tRNA(fMet)-specific endonuclease VapC